MISPRCFVFLLFLLSASVAVAEGPYATPMQTFETYLKACQNGDYKAAENCYTRSSRELVEKQMAGGAQRDPEALKGLYEGLSQVTFREELVNEKRAILWPDDEKFAPMFLRIQDVEEGWRLDYHFMSNYIRANDKGWSWRNERVYRIWKTRK